MYKVLERNTLFWVLFVLFGVCFLLNIGFYRPGDELAKWWRVVVSTPALTGLVAYLLGATPAWRWAWKRLPILSRWIFPDLNGQWSTEMHSNILSMAETHPDFENVDKDKINSKIAGKFRIEQNWFRIFIRFVSDSRYSTSNTIVVQPKKDRETGRFTLTYVFRNDTIDPVTTDEQFHFGSASLEIETSFDEMRGCYWTNRNWKKGLNTAGILTVNRIG